MERTTYATVVELPADEWEKLAAPAEADERTVSQQAARMLRQALRTTEERRPDRQGVPA